MEKIKSYFKDWTMFEKSWLLISSVTMVVLSLMWGDSMIALLSGLAGITVWFCVQKVRSRTMRLDFFRQ